MAENDFRDGPLADKEKIRKKGLEDRLRERTRLGDLAFILGTRPGRRYMHGLIYNCGILRDNMSGNNTTFWNLGIAEVGRRLTLEIKENFFDMWLLMEKEARQKDEPKEDGPKMMEDPKAPASAGSEE